MEKSPSPPHGNDPMQPVYELIQGGDPAAICAKYGISPEELDGRVRTFQSTRRQMALEEFLTPDRVGRNDPCPCGSGKKYKKCCLPKHEEARKNMPPDRLRAMEERAKQADRLEKEVQHGFGLLVSLDYGKAQRLAERLIAEFPEDDRLHDIHATALLAAGDYDEAFLLCRRRWQVAQEEKEFYQQNGYHQRAGQDQSRLVHFYSPSTWLEKFWIAQRARTYRSAFPATENPELAKLVEQLKVANDTSRFKGRQEEGLAMRQQALAPVLEQLQAQGPSAVAYLLPLTYAFSWASLFVPDLLAACGTDECLQLLAELSMFRFPYFAQQCLVNLEKAGERAVTPIKRVLEENPAFDELKVGLIMVLGAVQTEESFAILAGLTEHENSYVVNWTAQALGRQQNPGALPYLEKAKTRLGELSKIAGAIKELAAMQGK